MPPDPLWFKALSLLIQALVGAGSALIAVWITQRNAEKERKHRIFENLYSPVIESHVAVYKSLLSLLEMVKSTDGNFGEAPEFSVFYSVFTENLIWLNNELSNNLIDLVELFGSSDVTRDVIINKIAIVQNEIRAAIGIGELQDILHEFKKGD